MRILLVEDEQKLAVFVRQALLEDGHAVDHCARGDEGAHLAFTGDYDALVLDLQLPDRDGMTILRELRQLGRETPVLVLTARGSVQDRVRGLDAGADGYLTKPFALAELRARLRALLRRGTGRTSQFLRFANLSMDLLHRTAHRGEREIDLSGKEFALLEYLLRNVGRVVTRSSIAEHVWDYNFKWNSNVLEVFIHSLRRKTEQDGEPRLIWTLRGIGFVLREGGEDEG